MDKRTAEIIMVCKGNHDFGNFDTFKQAVAAYMSDRCCYPVDKYTDHMINGIIWSAAMDYIDGMKEYPPSSFWWEVHRAMDLHNNPLTLLKPIDMYEAMCIAFQLAQVRNTDGYINGFTRENTNFVYKS